MRRSSITVLLYFFIISQSKASQIDIQKTSNYNVNSSSEYIFESYPNQELIPIRLIGAIKNAGLYHIPSDMKLTTLIALAGGTTSDADIENIIIGNDQKTKKSSTINLEQTLKSDAETDYTLKGNDIVLIKNKSPMISNDTVRTVSMVSIVLTTILTAMLIKERNNHK